MTEPTRPWRPTAIVSAVAPAAGTPSGSVIFNDGTSVLGTGTLTNGTATFASASLTVGTHSITASYGGDAVFAPAASGPVVQTVKKVAVTVTVASSKNPSVGGDPITLTSHVNGPAGAAAPLPRPRARPPRGPPG